MSKLIVRVSVILSAIYLTICYLCAQFLGIDILYPWYNLLFELCVVLYCFSEGKYHCKFIRYTAISILGADLITQLDLHYDFLGVTAHNTIPVLLLTAGITTSCILSIRHFINVLRLKMKPYDRNICNEKACIISDRHN